MFSYEYEVWDNHAGNLVTTFQHRNDALAWIREVWDEEPKWVYDYALLGFDSAGRHVAIADGKDLIELALDEKGNTSPP